MLREIYELIFAKKHLFHSTLLKFEFFLGKSCFKKIKAMNANLKQKKSCCKLDVFLVFYRTSLWSL